METRGFCYAPLLSSSGIIGDSLQWLRCAGILPVPSLQLGPGRQSGNLSNYSSLHALVVEKPVVICVESNLVKVLGLAALPNQLIHGCAEQILIIENVAGSFPNFLQ